MATKYIFVTGGVVSGLGKGITAASIGRLLKSRGVKVAIQKFDPYLNFDPSSMSPLQHGEVFITDDGAHDDLDVGHYERFIDENATINSNITTGKIYWSLINRERRGDFGGGTIQVIPHITNEIKNKVWAVTDEDESIEVVITEIGGTVGDIESLPFIEAIRQIATDVGRENVLYVHVSLLPYIAISNEIKTKPTQHSVKELLSLGIQPDIIVCRSELPLTDESREKLALFCNIPKECVIQNLTADTLYAVPVWLAEEGLDQVIVKRLGLKTKDLDLSEWNKMLTRLRNAKKEVNISIVGKFVSMPDAYLSVSEALRHGGIENDAKVNITLVDTEPLTDDNVAEAFKNADGIITAGGNFEGGFDGTMCAVKYARENNIPFFGISLGLQMMALEYAKNVMNLSDANTAEVDESAKNLVVDYIPYNDKSTRKGSYPCLLDENSKIAKIYGKPKTDERHRHILQINENFVADFINADLSISGLSDDGTVVEAIELKAHKFFIGVQFDPQFKSRPNRAHPLFKAFIAACIQ